MQLVLEDITVYGRRGPLLELDRFTVSTGECVLMAGEPGQGHTAMALVATGRLSPFSGRVRLVRDDGSTTEDRKERRRLTAVVDLPAVSEPDDAVPVGTVTAEGLALARRGAVPGEPTRWLERHDMGALRTVRVDEVGGAVRTALLTALAAERKEVRFLVLSLPDRHGGEPADWWEIAQAYASFGYGVVVQCGRSSARDLGADIPPAHGDSARRATPLEALRTRPPAAPRPTTADAERPAPDQSLDTAWLFGEVPADDQHEPGAPRAKEEDR